MNENQFVARFSLILVLVSLCLCGWNLYRAEVAEIRAANLETRLTFSESVIQRMLASEIRQQMQTPEFEFSIPQSGHITGESHEQKSN